MVVQLSLIPAARATALALALALLSGAVLVTLTAIAVVENGNPAVAQLTEWAVFKPCR